MKYLIAYHLNDTEDYILEVIPDAIYAIDPEAIQCFDNVWLVSSSFSVSEIKSRINELLDPGDKLIISIVGDTEFTGFDSEIAEKLSPSSEK